MLVPRVRGLQLMLASLTVAIGVAGLSCAQATNPDAPVASVVVVPTTATVTVGATTPLGAAALDADGGRLQRAISWSSSDAGVATVAGQGDSVGIVTGVSLGTATITATSEGKSGSATVTVTNVPVATITVSPASGSVAIGDSMQFTAAAKDSAGNTLTGRTIVWSSSDTAVATVSLLGWAKGRTAGAATVRASAEGKTGTAALTVTGSSPPPPGPDEPVYRAGQDTSYMFDGFEAFTSTADLLTWQSHYPGRWVKNSATNTTNALLTTAGAIEGSHAVRFTYSGSGGEQQDLLIESDQTGVPAGAASVVVTFYLRGQPGYPWIGEAGGTCNSGVGHKIFNLNVGGAATSTRILLSFAQEPQTPHITGTLPDSSGPYTNLSELRPQYSIGNNNWNQNMHYARIQPDGGSLFALNDGNWHRYTTRLTASAHARPTGDTGDGRVEMWIDGTKVIEYIGDDPSRPEHGLVNVPSLAQGSLIPSLHFPSTRNCSPGPNDIWLEYDGIRTWASR